MTTSVVLGTFWLIWASFGWIWAGLRYLYTGPPRLTIPGMGPAPFWEGLARMAIQTGFLGPIIWLDSPRKGVGGGWIRNKRL